MRNTTNAEMDSSNFQAQMIELILRREHNITTTKILPADQSIGAVVHLENQVGPLKEEELNIICEYGEPRFLLRRGGCPLESYDAIYKLIPAVVDAILTNRVCKGCKEWSEKQCHSTKS